MVDAGGGVSHFLARERQALGDLSDEILATTGLKIDDGSAAAPEGESKTGYGVSQESFMSKADTDVEPECIRRNRTGEYIYCTFQDLNSWATQYRDTLSRGIKNSRTHDKELLKEQNNAVRASTALSGADPTQAALWERVCHLCNFVSPTAEEASSGSPTKRTGSKDGRDLQRMRTLLLQLKQNPPVRRG
ncbi:Clathrin light chain [Fasciola hepatica]|uniref:Clathrin light chain n=1 Tax=Fasciola hepatica TaxID=6192 RepID=A0A4E0RTG7_FASHE|nr:Clathrin light chain [Fasciola hepatica]